jgi:hypothetical protein
MLGPGCARGRQFLRTARGHWPLISRPSGIDI